MHACVFYIFAVSVYLWQFRWFEALVDINSPDDTAIQTITFEEIK